ncbi:hypothetical protein DICPUDRAFT_159197 [Dictyostelium purpureum]|uniref:Uncharacterized protein n=1 Tax=Dictyostelium purpureum TaxID=5786 RepID=F1A3I5_DICPU|nr:uncharacterized protein DICPUDRAFT_159197 [Dictyostelium purpureum]EGC29245.1 hypothetical protein DICPUDRAFT_159197 [Dictyostelium purpureum]|eukprot:XP_003294228.1 hypothetical protein DICPUDRAFT_159197 [Dictyostelium purpureum]
MGTSYLNYTNALLLTLKIEHGYTEEKKPDNPVREKELYIQFKRKNYKLTI